MQGTASDALPGTACSAAWSKASLHSVNGRSHSVVTARVDRGPAKLKKKIIKKFKDG